MIIDSTNRQETIYSEISDKLSDFKNDNVQKTIHRFSESDSVRETTVKQPDRRRKEDTGGGWVRKKLR